ncbi:MULTISPECIES: DUF4865 family protein [unclassified Streptomyces]|uniref:DUF4865 family protein n=1 Tax=unclassified Streptomyces TaxID=2593676 RepID=UPI002256A36B|nr:MULTISPECIES: DUF4865 family protein [unclassified Streptomyces]MCX5053240.1 DUF4865 family protein [Streptomyces sp. NBC_00474]MCX5059491.1 DUF4865 family protein [Streptomyces sp. NBC_00452]MCX5243863.1 DUF4865 family protein [Streptomyces sp. NBC_00201]MCX5290403.1 DUF4865 family protein [Streptomyces sp. NBC_00183]
MHAMQYELTLPADYDTGSIRGRVARVGHLLDDWDGLGLKTYLLRERGVNGSPVNQYAPFYLWNTMEGMNSFLWGGAFQGLSNDFGRPSVRQWTGLAYEERGGAGLPARFAVRRRQPVPEGVELAGVTADAVRETERLAGEDGAVLAAAAVDSSRWELVHFSLWEHDAPKADGDVFEVLHMSAPGRDLLPRGQQW